MSFRLTILGSSSAIPSVNRNPTSQLLNVNERCYLIDCGEGTQVQLRIIFSLVTCMEIIILV
jgi:ribonuclease Z